jgi:hypothetical protein
MKQTMSEIIFKPSGVFGKNMSKISTKLKR